MSTQSELEASLKVEAEANVKSLVASNETAANIAASVGTSKEVQAAIGEYSKYIPKGKFPTTLDQGADWAEAALTSYAKDKGKQWGATAIRSVASAYGLEGYIPDEIPTNEKEAAAALVDIASTAAASELGVDPRLVKVTAEAVLDGELDKKDGEAIGSLAGSIAGAALCQTFGIPAPIGAFLGGELGGYIGGAIADIFGASDAARKKWIAEQKRIVAQIHAEKSKQCMLIREGYWKTFDAYVLSAERSWEDMELKAGHLFDIRWFGRTPTPQFLQYVQQQQSSTLGTRYKNRIGTQSCDIVCIDGSVLKNTPKPSMTTMSPQQITALQQQCKDLFSKNTHIPYAQKAGMLISGVPAPRDSCGLDCIADYGCLYPDMSPYTQYPQLPTLASPKRVCSAYYALGFEWLQPPPMSVVPASVAAKMGPVRLLGCTLPEATRRAVEDTKYRKIWVAWLDKMLAVEERRIDNLNSASVRLFGDLAQTAAMVAVQKKISDSKTRSALQGLSGSDPAITRASSWVNNGTLVAGLGWLAYNSKRSR